MAVANRAELILEQLKPLALDPVVSEYVSEVVGSVLEEGGRAKQIKAAVEPILEDTILDQDLLNNVCHGIQTKCKTDDDGDDDDDADYLVDCRGIILAYAGKQLLKPTSLKLKRNHRYGVVGNNGVGKTTLLNRIASKEVNGFPQDIKVLYIQHEVYVDLECTVTDFMEMQQKEAGTDSKLVYDALSSIGFTEERMASPVAELSGGWRMKLAIATAVTQKCDLLLLDEPTNHLDVASRDWLRDYLVTLTSTTVCIVSHDYEFLTKTCSDIMHIANLQLSYYGGGFDNFSQQRPEVVAALPTITESGASAVITLPDPGKLEGVKSRTKPVLELKNLTFCYPNTEKPTLEGVCSKMCITSRVALQGPNGAGKTTLLRQMVGDLALDQGTGKHGGEIIKHQNLRISYISQHAMHHLEDSLKKSPVQYVQERFVTGLDKELAKRETMKLTEEEEKKRLQRGNISEIVGRALRGGELSYETVRCGREEDGTFWEPLAGIKLKDPYVLKLCLNYDEKMKAFQSGAEIRPCNEQEILKHLATFGISHRLAQAGKIKGMSGGQKCRLVLASAVWNMPHLIALDEPTNYIDNETLHALSSALNKFKGAVLLISHNQNFVDEICNEKWLVDGGRVSILQSAKEGKTLRKTDSQNSMETSESRESLDDA